jgi:erythromycin esterase-like protein
MATATLSALIDTIRAAAEPLSCSSGDYDALLSLIGDARFVLLGEASHGTHEFYRERAEMTKRLIDEKGFNAVAAEADWPDAYRVNCYVRGASRDASAGEALGGFARFPTWMWRNRDVLAFVEWLREWNRSAGQKGRQVGFYGLDLYSLFDSIEAVLRYLDRVDPDAAARARGRYACFEHFQQDSQAYGYAASSGRMESCEEDVVQQLLEIQRAGPQYTSLDGQLAAEDFFFAEQNARVVKNAEEYYRSMFRGRVSSWNLRDRHMAQTLDELVAHLESQGERAKVVVWAHNSHLGDARATDMGESGELNLGQLARERYGNDAFLVGFSTYTGTVTAADDWGDAPDRKRVRPGLPESYEALFHGVGPPRFLLPLRGDDALAQALRRPRLQRAIGVIYRPQSERWSHYFHTRLPEQFDAMLHFDETTAVEPLERTVAWDAGEPPETYPTGV